MLEASERYLGAHLGDLVIERFIGAGKFAWVYEARAGSTSADARAAVKVLHRDDEQGRRRFQREIKVMRELPPHPNRVGYRAHGVLDDGAPWVAMELVDGFTLQSIMTSGRRVRERPACVLMAQVCDGFRELHALGLTHRDITPDNIMLTHADRVVKIMDFGLAQDSQGILKLFEERDILAGHDFADDLDAGLIAGTPEFMAPEQITDPRRGARQTDTTADVFALGVVFYQLLTGHQLFPFAPIAQGLRGREALVRYLNHRQAVTDDDMVCPDEVGAELWTIVKKALSRDPRMRQRSAAELADDLRFYLETGQGVLEDDLSQTVSHALDARALRSSGVRARAETTESSDRRIRRRESVAGSLEGARPAGASSDALTTPPPWPSDSPIPARALTEAELDDLRGGADPEPTAASASPAPRATSHVTRPSSPPTPPARGVARRAPPDAPLGPASRRTGEVVRRRPPADDATTLTSRARHAPNDDEATTIESRAPVIPPPGLATTVESRAPSLPPSPARPAKADRRRARPATVLLLTLAALAAVAMLALFLTR